MEKFRPENLSNVEITKRDVLESLVKNPKDLSVYNEWRSVREKRSRLDASSWGTLGLQVESTKILLKAAEISRDLVLFGDALRLMGYTMIYVSGERHEVLGKKLFSDYIAFKEKFIEATLESDNKTLFENAIDALCDIGDVAESAGIGNEELCDESSRGYRVVLAKYKERFKKEENQDNQS